MADHNYYSDIDDVRLVVMDAISETDIDDAVFVRGALHVYNLINAKLGKLYTVPFPLSTTGNTPGIIKEISDTLTACWANTHTKGLSSKSRGPTADECKRARDLIDSIAGGDLTIIGHTSSALPESIARGEHKVFGEVPDLEWGQDATQASRISDERE